MSRRTASAIVSISCMLLGVTCSLSFGLWSDFTIFGMTIFDLFDFVASKILMPIGGLVICLFVGWYLDKKLVHDEITNQGTVPFRFFQSFIFLVRYVVPVAMTLIFVNELLFR